MIPRGLIVAFFVVACGGDHKRPPLEEVPIGTTPSEHSGDVTSAPMPTGATETAPRPTASGKHTTRPPRR